VDWEEVTTRKKMEEEKLPQKYDEKIPIKSTKKSGILSLLEKGVVPSTYFDFYNNL